MFCVLHNGNNKQKYSAACFIALQENHKTFQGTQVYVKAYQSIEKQTPLWVFKHFSRSAKLLFPIYKYNTCIP